TDAAAQRVENLNVRYRESIAAGAVLPTNAVRTCPSCAEPGEALYSSNHGPHVMHYYRCTDKECAERWVAGEFSMCQQDGARLDSLQACLEALKRAAAALEQQREQRRQDLRIVTQDTHRERAA